MFEKSNIPMTFAIHSSTTTATGTRTTTSTARQIRRATHGVTSKSSVTPSNYRTDLMVSPRAV